jgi:hypothetical protein
VKEQGIIRHGTTPGQDLDSEEIGVTRTAVCAAMKSFQVVFWLRLGCRRDAVSLENVSDRLIGDIVTEVGQCAGDPIVATAGVLPGHAHERLNRRIHARASG